MSSKESSRDTEKEQRIRQLERVMLGTLAALGALLAVTLPSLSFTPNLIAFELAATIIGLFAMGTLQPRFRTEFLTLGMFTVIFGTFLPWWWPRSDASLRWAQDGWASLVPLLQRWLLSWHGLDKLVHADTMLFILGLTLLVAVVAESRLLEHVTFRLLRRFHFAVVPTVLFVTALVSIASGILDGVSMIGLLMRTLTILLLLDRTVQLADRRFAVIICTIVTTVCGMWLAYGEPPNLIMKANLIRSDGSSYLTYEFFLTWCLPMAVASFGVLAVNLRHRFRGHVIPEASIDTLEEHSAIFRFLQAERHGEVLETADVLEYKGIAEALGEEQRTLLKILLGKSGKSLGLLLVEMRVKEALRLQILGKLTNEAIAARLDAYFVARDKSRVESEAGSAHHPPAAEGVPPQSSVEPGLGIAPSLDEETLGVIAMEESRRQRVQRFIIAGLTIFVLLLIAHAANHEIPLFVSAFMGYAVCHFGIRRYPKIVGLARHNALHEYKRYLFLLPLFASITLLTRTGFFTQLQLLLVDAIKSLGITAVALAQFLGCIGLSALLDNNVVADFAARALLNLDESLIHFFAAAQIAGYAVGGCWTHIGSAQSVVAFGYIQKEIDSKYTPLDWVKDISALILQLIVVLAVMLVVLGFLHGVN